MDTLLELLPRALVGAIAAGVVFVLGIVGTQAQPNHHGWRQIKAGPMYWTGLGLGGVLTGLMSYVWLFIGSSRADAESQMMILFYLVLAFGIGTIGVGIQTWLIAKRNILWRGTSLRFASGDTSKIREFRDIETMTQTVWGGVALNFEGGAALNLDPNAQGARELFEALSSFLDARPDNSK